MIMNKEMYVNRRDKALKSLEPGQAVLIFANPQPGGIYHFIQEKNFLYFTGLNLPNAILIMANWGKTSSSFLFIDRNIPEMIVWEGEKMHKEEATELSGIESVFYLDEFERIISGYAVSLKTVYTHSFQIALGNPLTRAAMWIQQLRTHFPHLSFDGLGKVVTPLRSVKEPWELEQMQKAIDITGQGIRKIMDNSQVGMMEYALESMLYHEMLSNGYRHWGFRPIIAGGHNATTLHYEDNDCVVEKDVLVLLDVGASCNGYSADITRTYPIAKKFKKRQLDVYKAVLETQETVIGMIKPGVSMTELNETAVKILTKAMLKLKLITDEKDFRRYYMHSIGHHLGLDTHDVGARDSVLEVGNVITVEPGIYIPEESLGVRIEDDILVTETGYRNLSINIPKAPKALEEIRAAALAK
ncbi:MAG: aminopeptidase P family protein [Candidatus Cloacimonetes bacterium]|nr:aminopeptidase P family protein [Candidatus Cloacimonadota bacterium]